MSFREWLNPPRVITRYVFHTDKVTEPVCLAVASDLHNGAFDDVKDTLLSCDAVLMPGDLIDRHHPGMDQVTAFFREIAERVPVFMSTGNHEWRSREAEAFRQLLSGSAVIRVDGRWTRFREIMIGGLPSAETMPESPAFLGEAPEESFRLLLCHHPEWYKPCVQPFGIDLTVAGHAHGGQVRIHGQGLYAPGQGIFPRLTDGLYAENRLLISRGMTNSSHWAPRIGNPCQLILLQIEPGQAGVWRIPAEGGNT